MDNYDKEHKPRNRSVLFEMSRADLNVQDKKWKPKNNFDDTFKPT